MFFNFRFMWRKHPQFDETGITLISSLWPDSIPPYLDAVYENVESNVVLFFKGKATPYRSIMSSVNSQDLCDHDVFVSGHQYWTMRQLKLEDGFPKNISHFGFPSRIQSIEAALHFRNDRYTVFFTGHECWRYQQVYYQFLCSFSQQSKYEHFISIL